jgi:hypothetical protein
MDVFTAVKKVVIPCIEAQAQNYPNKYITVNFEYAQDGAMMRDYVREYFRNKNPRVLVNLAFQKPRDSDDPVGF